MSFLHAQRLLAAARRGRRWPSAYVARPPPAPPRHRALHQPGPPRPSIAPDRLGLAPPRRPGAGRRRARPHRRSALAQPARPERVPRDEGVVVLAIDVSASMTATDIAPSRLEAAIAGARSSSTRCPPGIEVGLVAFDGNARLLVDPTTDHERSSTPSHTLTTDEPGTATGEGITPRSTPSPRPWPTTGSGTTASADDRCPPRSSCSPTASTTVGRPVEHAAAAAADAGVPVTTIAFGTPTGTVTVEGRDRRRPRRHRHDGGGRRDDRRHVLRGHLGRRARGRLHRHPDHRRLRRPSPEEVARAFLGGAFALLLLASGVAIFTIARTAVIPTALIARSHRMTLISPDRLWLLALVALLAVAYVGRSGAHRHTPSATPTSPSSPRSPPAGPGGAGTSPPALLVLATGGARARPGPARPRRRGAARRGGGRPGDGHLGVDDRHRRGAHPARRRPRPRPRTSWSRPRPGTASAWSPSTPRRTRWRRPPPTGPSSLAALDSLEAANGTAAGDGLATAVDVVDADATANPSTTDPYRAIILLADGDSSTGKTLAEATQDAVDIDVPVFTIAYGTADATIVVDGTTMDAGADPTTIAAVATATGGTDYTASTSGELSNVYDQIGTTIAAGTENVELTVPLALVGAALLSVALIATMAWTPRLT